jgi:hypothetical protein
MGQGRDLPQRTHQPDIVGRFGGEIVEQPQYARRVLERPGEHAAEDLRSDRIQPEFEGSHHAEVAAAAAQPPEERGVLGSARDAMRAVGGHHVA